jgi:hypothetical protein
MLEGGALAPVTFGVTAQAVHDAFVAEGEDPNAWALFCADPASEAPDAELRLGLRLDQLALLALAVLFEEEPRRP